MEQRSTASFLLPGYRLKSIGPRTTLKLVEIDVPCSGPNKKTAEIKFLYWDLVVIILKRIISFCDRELQISTDRIRHL